MNGTTFGRFWELLGWVLALKVQEAFDQLNVLPYSLAIALLVVLAAGLSQGVAHGAILFVNRVRPVRFIFSLLIGAVIFAFGSLFWVASTWLIGFLPFTIKIPFDTLIRVLGFSYAPLVFSLFGAMPYLGEPILWVLSLWQLLVVVAGFMAVSEGSVWQALATVALGWAMLSVLQQTLGQPVVRFAHWLADQAAGVELIAKRKRLASIVQQLQSASMTEAATETVQEDAPKAADSKLKRFKLGRTARNVISLTVIAAITFIAVMLLAPIRRWWFPWYASLGGVFQLIFDVGWIGIVAFMSAALVAPIEALAWSAGWYGEQRFSPEGAPPPAKSLPKATRYIIYLDGVSQSKFQHTPDIQDFFDALTPALPSSMVFIKEIMIYSVRDKPLTQNRPLSFFWRLADSFRFKNPASLFGYLVNIRNSLVVTVSADRRYGPIYNLGIARVMYRTLMQYGYQPDSGSPVTLIGFSGGGQMAIAAVPLLRQALRAPIEVISLGGVMSGNINILKLEHLYHLSGKKDLVERIGPVMFPKRWAVFFLSYWNRAKRMGKVSFISLGPVSHELPGGIMDPDAYLPDGRSHLQQTIDWIVRILQGAVEPEAPTISQKLSDYDRFRAADFNRPDYYPIEPSAPPGYRAIAPWMGRLILPAKSQRESVKGVLFEVHHAADDFQHLVGQTVTLRYSDRPRTRSYVQTVTKDVYFSAKAKGSSRKGNVHPTRIDRWKMVNPLESLAGSHPVDDVTVMLPGPVVVQQSDDLPPALCLKDLS